MQKLSVVIPVYNVEDYLRQCLDSILAQTYTDMEIIVVNDGSKDGSLLICEEFAQKDERVRVYSQANGGLSAARNTGMQYATGEYITFIDSDDYVDADMFRHMISEMERLDADISVCNMKKFWGDGAEECETKQVSPEILTATEAIGKLYTDEQAIFVTACGKVYRRVLFEDIIYPVGKLNEDAFTTYKTYAKAEKVIYLDMPLYKYRQREGSIIHSPFTVKSLDALDAQREMKDFVLTIDGFIKKYNVIGEFTEKLIDYYYRLTELKGEKRAELKVKLYAEAKELICNYFANLSIKEKIKFSCFAVSPRIYRLIRGGLKAKAQREWNNLKNKALRRLYVLKPIQKNKIILWSNGFTFYGCNPKHIAEYILKEHEGEFDIVWAVDSRLPVPKDIPEVIRIVRVFSKEYLYELHTAHFVICNSRTGKSTFWHKRRGQVYIQTWHSALRLKMIEKDAEEYLSPNYIKSAIEDSSKMDYILSGCRFSTDIYKNSFWYNGKVLEWGTPRIDYLLNGENKKTALEKVGLSAEYKYILYAPTFRSNYEFDYNLDFKKIVELCEKKMGGKWKVLYRLHPNLIFDKTEQKFGSEGIDVCRYSDMQELVMASDIMITDYSSCMFDAMYANKLCFLHMPDYREYTEKERKLYFKFEDLPFEKSYDESELYENISNFDIEKYNQKINGFLEFIGSFEDGQSCERLCKLIKDSVK